MIRNAGPAAKADARNLGARMAVSQNPRPGRPQYRYAVTVWMPMAKGMERYTRGFVHHTGSTWFLSASSTFQPTTMFKKQIPVENNHVIKKHGVGGGVQEHIQHTDGLA